MARTVAEYFFCAVRSEIRGFYNVPTAEPRLENPKVKAGARPKSDEMKKLTGTFRSDRAHGSLSPLNLDDPAMPAFLTGRAAKLWRLRLADYRARRVSVAGADRLLAHLCALDAAMEAMWRRGETPKPAMVTALRTMASLFYEGPANQVGLGKPPVDGPSPFDEFRTGSPFDKFLASPEDRQ